MPRQRAAAGSGPVSDAPAHRSTLRVHSRTSEQLLRPLCNRRRARSRVVQAVELVGETAEIVNGPGLRAGTEAQLRRQSARRRLPIRRARWPPGWCRG